MKTVICVGTSLLYAEGAASLMEQCGKGRIRAFALSPTECLRAPLTADILVVDLPTDAGSDFVRAVHQRTPWVQIIALVPSQEDAASRYAHVDIAAFVACDCSAMQLVATLIDATAGAEQMTGAVRLCAAERDAASACPRELTPRQRQVLELIDQGLSNKEIARELRVGLPTVKNHVHDILSKTRLRRRTQAVRILRSPGNWMRSLPVGQKT